MDNKFSKKFLLVVACLLLACSPQVHAQNTQQLSLKEAIQLAVENSKQLKLSSAKVDEAVAKARNAWNNHLPDVKVSGSYIRLNNPDVALKVKLGNESVGKPVAVHEAGYAIANVSLPLFSGFRIKYGVESAKYLEQAARLDADENKEEVIANTMLAYNNLYKSKKTVDLVKENLAREEQRVKDFSNLERNGLLARNDLLKAQLQQSNTELALLEAENNYNITCANMDLMLGLPEGMLLIPDTTGFVILTDIGTLSKWEQLAFENRKDVSALSYEEKAANAAIKATKGEYYPGIALTGGTIAAQVPNVLTITNALNAGIGLQYNIGSLWKTGAKVNEAKARLHQVEATQGMLADKVRIDVNKAYQNYLLSVRKIDVYARALEQANENYRITKNKYDNSLVTTTDLLDADVAQLQARLNYAFSKADANLAYYRLKQTSGTISEL
jgi:outer membrane protein TolC